MTGRDPTTVPEKIEQRVKQLVTPLQEFVADQAVAGGILVLCAVAALVLANSDWAPGYESVRHTVVGIHVGGWQLSMSLQHWINDGLMALFFFLLGLEIKRELLAGDLQDARQARLLVLTALGGMAAPALVYTALSPGPAADGWGIPMATDTAFAIGALALLKGRVPGVLATFLVGLAIIDDIGAMLVIALFYSQDLSVEALMAVAGLFLVLVCFNVLGVRRPFFYLAVGCVLWYAVLRSGVHPTLAGVLVAITVPARPLYSGGSFAARIERLLQRFRGHTEKHEDILGAASKHEIVEEVRKTARRATTPLQRWETALETPISLLILPLFALANAGIDIHADAALAAEGDSVILAIAGGLVLGKLCGITGFCWAGLRLGFGALPPDMTMRHVAGLSLLAGMGFTMSIFIANLAFAGNETMLERAKAGVLLGTAVAGLAGYLVLRSPTSPASGPRTSTADGDSRSSGTSA